MEKDREDGNRDANADAFLRHISGSPEDEADRKGRHFVEGQLSWSAVRELQELGRTVGQLAASVDKVTTLAAGTEKAVAEMRGWLLDTYDSSGHSTPGILNQMKNLTEALLVFTTASEKRANDRNALFETYGRIVVGGIVTITLTVLAQAFHFVH